MDNKKRVLIVDDDEGASKLAEFILKQEGFETYTASDGVEGLEKMYEISPDLLLLDIDMPRMNGFQVCTKIRGDTLFRHLPIIMLTGSREEDSLTKALGFGSDDYILKPYKRAELLARVRGILERTSRVLDANPLTKLPGNIAIIDEIEKRIQKNSIFGVLYIDLNKFKSYNDKYGFVRGDNVIRLTARIMIETISDIGDDEDFAGHIGGDDFVIVTTPEKSVPMCSQIIKNFDGRISEFYDVDDRRKGFIRCKNRKGEETNFPIMSVGIGVVTNEKRKIKHPGEVSAIGAELKKYVKGLPGSNYKMDNRIK